MDTEELKKILKNFLDADGRLKQHPARTKMQVYALCYLSTKFEKERVYSEQEVNAVIGQWHTYSDWTTLRRGLCDFGLLSRKKDGSEYRVTGKWPEIPS